MKRKKCSSSEYMFSWMDRPNLGLLVYGAKTDGDAGVSMWFYFLGVWQLTYSSANECFNVTAPKNPLCLTNDTSGLSFTQRVCNCPGVCLASALSRAGSSLNATKIGGIGVGVAVALLLLLALLWFGCLGRRHNHLLPGKAEAPIKSHHRTATTSSSSSTGKFRSGSFPSSPT